jgi:hypothetical protein
MVIRFVRSAIAACLLAGFGMAPAAVYDDFKGDQIDVQKWVSQEGVDLFSQSHGRLHFPCKEQASQRMYSTAPFPPGFFQLEFRDYSSTNVSTASRGLGSYLAIGLAAGEERVRTIRGDVRRGGYFEANHFGTHGLQLWYAEESAESGQLGLYFDGSAVSFHFKAGAAANNAWRKIGPTVRPTWTTLPRLYIAGSSGGSGCTRFSIVAVEHIAVPLPASLLKELGL